jgi:hypothetical protein
MHRRRHHIDASATRPPDTTRTRHTTGIAMNMNRLSPVLLLLALAGPVHAQDLGPGVMLQELATLSDAGYAQDTGRGRAASAQRQARSPVEGRNAVGSGLWGRVGRESGTCADLRCSAPATSALRTSDTQGLDEPMADRAR